MIFALVLFQYLNFGLAPMLVIVIGIAVFQYYTSDKLALAPQDLVVRRSRQPGPGRVRDVDNRSGSGSTRRAAHTEEPTNRPAGYKANLLRSHLRRCYKVAEVVCDRGRVEAHRGLGG